MFIVSNMVYPYVFEWLDYYVKINKWCCNYQILEISWKIHNDDNDYEIRVAHSTIFFGIFKSQKNGKSVTELGKKPRTVANIKKLNE